MPRTHERRLRNRQELRAHRQNQEELGYDFVLSATCIGAPEEDWVKARVKRISLRDAASIDQIPARLQDVVNKGLETLESAQKKIRDEGGANTETLRDRVKGNTDVLAAASAYCLATFIDPPLVESEDQLRDNPEAWLVTDVHPDDQVDIFFGNLDADSPAAKKFRLHRPERVIDVGHRDVGPVAAEPVSRPELVAVGRDES